MNGKWRFVPEVTAQTLVGVIYEDRQGILWVGTPQALEGIDRKAGHSTSHRRMAGPAESTDVIAIREDHSGMSLAICRSIVESYSGRLWASANNGAGGYVSVHSFCRR
ncbi:hypothetical protein H7849_08655 [Alloacidobacterium dinghuense]|uniref:Uncharacterized protein n=1 Tax=Alloacidobacterium dinghuense TaxID=2763107 RepID=A0A7G8BN41_9BACT|nr:two-component regulator propeller domain-containing protein [Alloacidobacterium dinghuense]QNI33961.1 hypothetical protein H7849_08655 [Alloacidobacterium dinghuense]